MANVEKKPLRFCPASVQVRAKFAVLPRGYASRTARLAASLSLVKPSSAEAVSSKTEYGRRIARAEVVDEVQCRAPERRQSGLHARCRVQHERHRGRRQVHVQRQSQSRKSRGAYLER